MPNDDDDDDDVLSIRGLGDGLITPTDFGVFNLTLII